MRAGLAALLVFAVLRAGLPRAHADEDTTPPIPIHPGVVTVLQLPDEIVHTWIDHHGEIRVARKGDKLYVRPRPGTPAGVEASLDVETRTARWTFPLRVVARARDARRHVLVPVEAQAPGESTLAVRPEEPAEPEAPPDEPAEPEAPPVAAPPEIAEPAASAPTNATTPAPPEPVSKPAPAENTTAAIARATATAGRSQFDLAAHVIGGLGFTGVNIAKYRPETALRPLYSLGLRLTGEPRSTPWAVQADVSAEWPAGPMLYRKSAATLKLSGPRLRLEMGTRASTGTKWKASVFTTIGIQVHLRRAETNGVAESTLARGVLLGLGVGLQYRTRSKVSLGLDFLVRQGWPEDYHSVGALLTLGRSLDQGERP